LNSLYKHAEGWPVNMYASASQWPQADKATQHCAMLGGVWALGSVQIACLSTVPTTRWSNCCCRTLL